MEVTLGYKRNLTINIVSKLNKAFMDIKNHLKLDLVSL